jgi:hypothetical protein
MSIRLSSSDVSALVRASSVLLSPFSYENGDDWQREACAAVQALVGGHASSSTLPVAGKVVIGGEPDVVRVLEAIHPPAEWVSYALIERRKDRQLTIADWSELFDVDKVRRSAFYNDIVRPNRLLASLNMMEEVVAGQLPAAISVYYRDERKAADTVAEKKNQAAADPARVSCGRQGLRVVRRTANCVNGAGRGSSFWRRAV